jgi:hypothetical protein
MWCVNEAWQLKTCACAIYVFLFLILSVQWRRRRLCVDMIISGSDSLTWWPQFLFDLYRMTPVSIWFVQDDPSFYLICTWWPQHLFYLQITYYPSFYFYLYTMTIPVASNYRYFILGMHRILFLPDIRLNQKPDTGYPIRVGYPAGYLAWQLYFW